MTDAALAYDDFDDVLDAEPAVERPMYGPEPNPYVNQREINVGLLRELDYDSWNRAIAEAREADPDFVLDFTGTSLYDMTLDHRNLNGAIFDNCDVQYARFQHAQLENTSFRGANVYGTNFSYAKLSGSNLRMANNINHATNLSRAIDYNPPLQDITEAVARHYLRELIDDPASIVNDGLAEMAAEGGFRVSWSNDRLNFWIATEIQRMQSDCSDNSCECERDHACEGGCDCCACYRGTCDCDYNHEWNLSGSDEWYLATLIGNISFVWSDAYGLRPRIYMNDTTKHPHVSESGSICWGNTEHPQDSLRIADHLLVILGWMNQHDPNDEYSPISYLPQIR